MYTKIYWKIVETVVFKFHSYLFRLNNKKKPPERPYKLRAARKNSLFLSEHVYRAVYVDDHTKGAISMVSRYWSGNPLNCFTVM